MTWLLEPVRLAREANVARNLALILQSLEEHHTLGFSIGSIINAVQDKRRCSHISNMGQCRTLSPFVRIIPWSAPDIPQSDVVVEPRTVLRCPVLHHSTYGCPLEPIRLGDGPATKDTSIAPTT